MIYPEALNVVQEAFAMLGQSAMPTVVDDEQENPTFRDCCRLYNGIRKALLTAHPWNFATAAKPISGSPAGIGTYLVPIPGDCLQVLRLEDENGREIVRQRVGKMLRTETMPCRIVYIRDDEEPDEWDPWARKAFVHRLAADFSRIVKGSMQERDLQEHAYANALAEAKRTNSQEVYATSSRTYADRLINGELN